METNGNQWIEANVIQPTKALRKDVNGVNHAAENWDSTDPNADMEP